MSEQTLRPIGTEFEQAIEGQFVRTIEHCRVTGHALENGRMVEVIELYNVTLVRKEPPGGSERK